VANRAPPSEQAVQQLTEAASLLDVEEILDLCFAFSKDPIRLTVYLDVLRRKGGQKAQAAACMICFDLARAGHGHFEREFTALLPVVHEIHGRGDQQIAPLIGDSQYLQGLWADLVRRLETNDPRVDLDTPDDEEILELDILDEQDIVDIELDAIVEVAESDIQQKLAWMDALNRFFVIELALPNLADPSSPLVTGFSAHGKGDLDRIERLRNDALSFRGSVRHAQDMLPVIELFRAVHMRSKNLFGRTNQARAVTLQDGLSSFAALEAPPLDVIDWLLPPTATLHAWEKVAEILLDFVAFLGSLPAGSLPDDESWPDRLAYAYLNSKRPQPPPDVLSHAPGQRRRG
jgi:hypothetical protein